MAFHSLSISALIYSKQGHPRLSGCSPMEKPCGTTQGPGPTCHCQLLGTTSNLCQKNATGETQQLFQAPNGAVTQEGQALSCSWHRQSTALFSTDTLSQRSPWREKAQKAQPFLPPITSLLLHSHNVGKQTKPIWKLV